MSEHSTAELDLSVAQALFAARLLESAVHHPGPWTFRWGGIEVSAEKFITDTGVIFTGDFPDVCYLRKPEGSLELRCEGIVMGIRSTGEMEHPGDTGFAVSWAVLARKDHVTS